MSDQLVRSDPRWTLGMETERRGLMRRTQWRKLPAEERKKFRVVYFKWGQTKVRGYKPKVT